MYVCVCVFLFFSFGNLVIGGGKYSTQAEGGGMSMSSMQRIQLMQKLSSGKDADSDPSAQNPSQVVPAMDLDSNPVIRDVVKPQVCV